MVVPNYNYGRYLKDRIWSLLEQSFIDYELIIVDDASTDESVELISQYTDPRIKNLFYEENSGSPYKRWNDGASVANGKYLLFAGADDVCDRSMLASLVDICENNPEVGIAYTQSLEIDSVGRILRNMKEWTDDLDKKRWASSFVSKGREMIDYFLVKNIIPTASAVLIRRDAFEEEGGFDDSFRLNADWLLYSRILLQRDLAFHAEPLNRFRRHASTVRSNSRSNGGHIEESYRVLRELISLPFIDIETRERVRSTMARRWLHYLATKRGRISLKRNTAIYRAAQNVDPHINRRILRHLPSAIKKNLKLWITRGS